MNTKTRLSTALAEAGLTELAAAAHTGRYDDFESDSPTPIVDLVRDLRAAGRADLAERAMNGEWDASREEAEAWAAGVSDPEVRAALDEMMPRSKQR